MNEKPEKHLKPHQLALQQRHLDSKTQMPVQNMSYKDKAPFISIIGPKDSGKEKLFNLLIATLTKKKNLRVDNIITISGSHNKISLHKSEENLSSYIDSVKISDLVILTINANKIEIDTFEIISLLKAHGMCKIVVVIENADRKNIKTVKKRVWKEITPGIKIYNVNIKSDIEKLAREIKNMKFRPLQFRCNNSYIIADKIQYKENNGKYDYFIYGYIRGCPMRSSKIHIPGNGDFAITSRDILDDPCSIFTKKLLEKEKINIYTPIFLEDITDKMEHKFETVIENDSEDFNLCDTQKIKVKQFDTEINIEEKTKITNNSEKEIHTEDETNSLDDLLDNIVDKFEAKPETEEDFVEKFNQKHNEKEEITNREAHLQQERINNLLINDFIPGQYVKITIADINKLKIDKLVILGSINFATKTVIQGRVKKSNHFIHSLKSNESYLVSIGWRREMVRIIFSYKDPTRNKFIKYILDDCHCNANFESNVIDPGTTFCIIKENQMMKDLKNQSYKATNNIFRIAALGTVTDVSGKTNIVKKLKLIGYPLKIDEHTVFVKDMFSSDKEVAKFEGAMLKSVGGIRGSVKKSVGQNGNFRATFEGRLLFSDIIVLKCYVPYVYQDHDDVCPPNKINKVLSKQKNMTDILENKKERKHAYKIKDAESKLNLDKRMIKEDFTVPQLPVDNAQKNYYKLKNELSERRQALQEHEIKRLKVEAGRLEKEKIIAEKERKEKLKKTIIEQNLFKSSKPKHKQHRKKTKKRK